MAHGCGYHDLDHLFTSPEDLTFTFGKNNATDYYSLSFPIYQTIYELV